MTEDHPPQSSDFTSEAARHTGNFFEDHPKVRNGLAIGAGVLAVGTFASFSPNLHGPSPAPKATAESDAPVNFDQQRFQDLLDNAKKQGFSDSTVVGKQFKITKEGEGPYEPALQEAGKDPDFASDPINVAMLLASAKNYVTVNIGDAFDVVKVDLAHNGEKEYIVVKDSDIIHETTGNTVPSPIQSYDLPDVSGDGSTN